MTTNVKGLDTRWECQHRGGRGALRRIVYYWGGKSKANEIADRVDWMRAMPAAQAAAAYIGNRQRLSSPIYISLDNISQEHHCSNWKRQEFAGKIIRHCWAPYCFCFLFNTLTSFAQKVNFYFQIYSYFCADVWVGAGYVSCWWWPFNGCDGWPNTCWALMNSIGSIAVDISDLLQALLLCMETLSRLVWYSYSYALWLSSFIQGVSRQKEELVGRPIVLLLHHGISFVTLVGARSLMTAKIFKRQSMDAFSLCILHNIEDV